MQLPTLVPGQRYTLPRPPGAADALFIAHLASARAAQGQLTLVVCAEPADTQRLADELPFFAPHLRIAVFPDWETLPYDQFSPHQDLVSERLATLWRLYRKSQGLGTANTGVAIVKAKGKAAPDPTKSVSANKEDDEGVDVVILPASTALTRLAPPSFLAATTFNFKQKSRLDEAALRSQLTLAGYSHVSSVVSPGEYAVRGGLIDLFPMGSQVPYRVDLFDNEVDSIRTFDPDTQRSLYPVPEVRLLPGREFALDEAARKAFRVRWRERIEGDPTKARLYKDMGHGIAGGGIEYYLPLFFDETATIFDYLPASAHLVLHGAVDEALQRFWADTRERYRFLKADPDRPILPPEDLFLKSEQFFDATRAHATLSLRPPGAPKPAEENSGSEDHIRADPSSPSGGSDGRSEGAVTS
ncbi:MAG: transcription-repair coupling factor, partial [Ramlibacter sp.]